MISQYLQDGIYGFGLKFLYLAEVGFTGKGMKDIFREMRKNSSVEVLALSGNRAGEVCGESLCRFLCGNKIVEVLAMNGCGMGDVVFEKVLEGL